MEAEGIVAAERAGSEQLVEQAAALDERATEALLLAADPFEDRLAAFDQLWVGRAHYVNHLLSESR